MHTKYLLFTANRVYRLQLLVLVRIVHFLAVHSYNKQYIVRDFITRISHTHLEMKEIYNSHHIWSLFEKSFLVDMARVANAPPDRKHADK